MQGTAAEPHEACVASMCAFSPDEVLGNAKEEKWRKITLCDVGCLCEGI